MTNSVLELKNIESIFHDYGDDTLPFIYHHYLNPKKHPGVRVMNQTGYVIYKGDRQLMFTQLDPSIYDDYKERNILGIHECKKLDSSTFKAGVAIQISLGEHSDIIFDLAHEYLNSERPLEDILIDHSDEIKLSMDSFSGLVTKNREYNITLIECI